MPSERIPALTIWQPWATLIAAGAKPYEFRRWCAPSAYWNKRLAIHAGARPARRAEIQDLLLRLRMGDDTLTLDHETAYPLLERALSAPGSLPLSSVVCIATLRKPLDPEEARQRFAPDSDRSEHHNYAWPLDDIEVLRPYVPAAGKQGFWTWESPA